MAVPSACRQHELVFGYVDLHRVNRACPQTLDGVTSKTKASRAQFVLLSASQPMVRELNRLEFDVFEVNPESRALSASEPIVLGVPSLPNISCLMGRSGNTLALHCRFQSRRNTTGRRLTRDRHPRTPGSLQFPHLIPTQLVPARLSLLEITNHAQQTSQVEGIKRCIID
jgi:hypothetical protein